MHWTEFLKRVFLNPIVRGERVVPILWGHPGVGKTARVTQIAREIGAHLEVVILSIRDATEVAGLPVKTQDGTVAIAPPTWAKRAAEAARSGKPVVVFFDELTTVPRSVQAAALRILLEGVVGDLELPENVAFVAAANPPEIAAGGFDLEPPMANRLVHLRVEPNAEEWTKWAAAQGGEFPLVAAFIRRRPDLLLVFPRERAKRGEAWPSPRSWARVAAVMEVLGTRDPATLAEAVVGAVGEGAATEFLAWLKAVDLPDPEEVLADPEGAKLPERDDLIFALVHGAIALVKERVVPARGEGLEAYEALFRLLSRIYREGYADIATAGASEMVQLTTDLIGAGAIEEPPAFYSEIAGEFKKALSSIRG